MPIRPENRGKYPLNWSQIARAVKDAAGWRCVCAGECGNDACAPRCTNVHMQRARSNGKVVILTVAHLDHDPENPDARLAAFCAPCHLRYDAEEHARVRRAHAKSPADSMLW